jgi:hypothetical protein
MQKTENLESYFETPLEDNQNNEIPHYKISFGTFVLRAPAPENSEQQ